MAQGALAQPVLETVLRDGSPVTLRQVSASDQGAILDFLAALTRDSLYRRFFSLRPDLDEMARRSAQVERGLRGGMIACPAGSPRVVGHAGYWRMRRGWAELAIVVADCWRGRGLGRLLLGELMNLARKDGVGVLEMDVLVNNEAGIGLLRTSGAAYAMELEAGVLRCRLQLG